MSIMSDETAKLEEFPNYTFYKDGKITNKYGQFIGSVDLCGYISSQLVDKDGNKKMRRFHRLFMVAFSNEECNNRHVDHINGIKTDNRYENLQYLDPKTHMQKTRADNPNMNIKRGISRYRAVEGIYIDGTTKVFNSVKEAFIFVEPDKNSNSSGVISTAIKNNTLYKNYKWKYLDNDDLEGEIWKSPIIDEIKDDIEVSNLGRIKYKTGVKTFGKKIAGGYIKVSVRINNKNCSRSIHTLVCSAFHGKQPEWASSVNHIDGNPLNNTIENLEWSDPVKQANSWRSKIHLMKNDVIEHTFNSIKEANEFLSAKNGVQNCLSGKNKTLKGYTVIRDSESNEIKKRERGSHTVGISIHQLDDHQNIIKEFPTFFSAIKEILPDTNTNNIHKRASQIKRSILGGFRAYGYYWKYVNEPENFQEMRIKYMEKSKEDDKKRQIRRKLLKEHVEE